MSVTINNLPSGSPLTGSEVLPLVQGNTTIKANVKDIGVAGRPYKVFTALLTQSGGSSVVGIYNGGDYPIVVGATYTIIDNGGYGWDFTNIGAPNNNIGTSFVATGTVPNSWGVYGLMEQNLGAPVATVLENTIGNIWFTYNGVGIYQIKSDGLFISDKTFIINGPLNNANTGGWDVQYEPVSTNLLNIAFFDISGNNVDGIGSNFPIEIRVYN